MGKKEKGSKISIDGDEPTIFSSYRLAKEHIDGDEHLSGYKPIEFELLGIRRLPSGCGRRLADNQYWHYCGESDMGQTSPVLCVECGGTFKLY